MIQKGYSATLFVPFSSLIEKSRNPYYKSFLLVHDNQIQTQVLYLTPFLQYFTDNVYHQIPQHMINTATLDNYRLALNKGLITEKETQLWTFVLSHYGTEEFSTKQLEKDFKEVADATIRNFVIKFEELDL